MKGLPAMLYKAIAGGGERAIGIGSEEMGGSLPLLLNVAELVSADLFENLNYLRFLVEDVVKVP